MIVSIYNKKSVLIYILLALLLITCHKNNQEIFENDLLNDGFYGGSFSYDSINHWYLLEIIHNNYEEWPSGGVMYQKSMGCLTTGTYLINDSIITFMLDSFKFEDYPESCVPAMILPGKYRLIYRDNYDSIVFEKETNNSKIIYMLKRSEPDNK